MIKKTKAPSKQKKKTAAAAPPAKIKQPEIGPEKQNVVPHPTAGKKVEEFEQKLQAQLDAAGTEEVGKRGRGRPRKDTAAAAEPGPELTEELLATALKIPFDVWAFKVGVPELKLDDNEAKVLATPVKDLLDYYLPKLPPIAVAWVSLSFTSYSIMRVRLQVLAEIRKQNTTFSPPQDPNGGGSQGDGSPPPPGGPVRVTRFPTIVNPIQL